MPRLLFIDDDLAFSPFIKEYLETQSFEVDWHPHSDAGLRAFHEGGYDLCLLDVRMPHKDGFTLAEEIRNKDEAIPIIFLTGAGEKSEKLRGFKLGADDYITKPLSLELMHARIEAVLRRYKGQIKRTEETQGPQDFQLGQYTFMHARRELQHSQQTVNLSGKEAALLYLLHKKNGELLSRDEALIAVWGENDYSKGMSLNVYISKIRKLLQHDPAIHLLNVHGEGYILRVDS